MSKVSLSGALPSWLLHAQNIEKRAAEARQKAKKAKKRGQAEASRQNAEMAVRSQLQRAQDLRSATFAAARAGDAAKVKKGVYEENVDAAGGEIKKGCEDFVAHTPKDPNETMLHIAVKNDDVELAKWLDAHSKSTDNSRDRSLPTKTSLQARNRTNGTLQVSHHSTLLCYMEEPKLSKPHSSRIIRRKTQSTRPFTPLPIQRPLYCLLLTLASQKRFG